MKKLLSMICLFLLMTNINAQKKLSMTAGVDIVNSYIWLGAEQGQGAAFQPNAAISYSGFTLGTWASTSIGMSAAEHKELDFYLSYTVGGLTLKLANNWWTGCSVDNLYFDKNTHHYDAAISYNFGEKFPLTLTVNTTVAGKVDADVDGQMYSTWIQASYPFSINDFDITPRITFTPLEGNYSDSFDILEATIRVSKSIKITDSFSLPLFTEAICAPAYDDAHLIFGLSLSL